MGKALSRASCPTGTVEMVVANIGTPQNARSAARQPERRAATRASCGSPFADPEERKLSQARARRQGRARSSPASSPASRSCSTPAASSPASSPTATSAPLVVEVRGDNLDELDAQAQAVAEVARTVPGIRDVRASLQIDYPEIHVDTDREKAGLVGVTARDGGADDARGDARQHQHARRLDRSRTTASRTTSSPPTTARSVADTQALGALPVRVERDGQAGRSSAPTATSAAPSGRSRSSATTSQRAAHVLMQTEGRDIGSAAAELETALAARTRARATSTVDFVGQVELMRDDLLRASASRSASR